MENYSLDNISLLLLYEGGSFADEQKPGDDPAPAKAGVKFPNAATEFSIANYCNWEKKVLENKFMKGILWKKLADPVSRDFPDNLRKNPPELRILRGTSGHLREK